MTDQRTSNRKVIIICLIALVALVGLFWAFWDGGFNWHVHSYQETDEEPYGSDLSYSYIKSLRPAEDFIRVDSTIGNNLRPFLDEGVRGHNYLILGYLPYLDSLSRDHLDRFVEEGNSVFMLLEGLPEELLSDWNQGDCILYEDYGEFEWMDGIGMVDTDNAYIDSLVSVNFTHPDLRLDEDLAFGHYVKDELKRHRWAYLKSEYFCEENSAFTALGTLNENYNYFRVPQGEGFYYVHTNAKLLTNYYLLQDKGRDYADRVFAHLAAGPIIWDAKSWNSPLDSQYYKERYAQHEGPLTYLLSQESLRWMLALLFAMALLFFLLASRRKQRAIPVLRPKENSSLEYVDTISQLYFTQSGDGRIFRYLSEQFQFYIRERYRVNFKWKEESTWPLVAKASGVPQAHLEKIVALQARGSYEPNVDNAMLTEYYQLMDYFYHNSK